MEKKEYTCDIAGTTFTATFTDLTNQAHGAVMLAAGDTVVLATAVMSEEANDSMPYFPLKVDYEERFYAAGKILGSRFVRREGRPSDEAVLSGRIVDRTIRPLFEHHIRHDIQVVITVLSVGEFSPDMLAVNAVSLALATSHIPWSGPVSAMRVGKHEGSEKFEINPTYAFRQDEKVDFDMIACGKDGTINMIEVGASQVGEDAVAGAFGEAVKHIEELQTFQEKIIKELGKEKKVIAAPELTPEAIALFEKDIVLKMEKFVFSGPGKAGIGTLKKEWVALLKETLPEEKTSLAAEYYENRVDKLIHVHALEKDARADGRGMDDVREIQAQAGGVSKTLHGSGTFYRGGTHVLSVLTLGGPEDSQIVNGMEGEQNRRFLHHYNFPPFSVGETGRVGGFNRRAIGHGALAEKALQAVIPSQEEFPYTIRIVSESMASNGSTSMGSACGSTLALMDAGVPIKAPVAGIAMGLMLGEKGDYKILTDIQGPEDHHGDMDFKVAGTADGVTAIQMDIKVGGIPVPILTEALEKAKTARLHILDVITKKIATPRAELSSYAPRILTTRVKIDQIGLVIGPGGKMVNGIRDKTGTEISIEDDGMIYITGSAEGAPEALRMIEQLTRVYKAGDTLNGPITRIMDFGAFVDLSNGSDGLVHISEIAPFRINNVSDALAVGEVVPVVVKEIDEKGRVNLSIKERDPEFAKNKGLAAPEHSPRPAPKA